jgi:hypothetical protein
MWTTISQSSKIPWSYSGYSLPHGHLILITHTARRSNTTYISMIDLDAEVKGEKSHGVNGGLDSHPAGREPVSAFIRDQCGNLLKARLGNGGWRRLIDAFRGKHKMRITTKLGQAASLMNDSAPRWTSSS